MIKRNESDVTYIVLRVQIILCYSVFNIILKIVHNSVTKHPIIMGFASKCSIDLKRSLKIVLTLKFPYLRHVTHFP